MDGAIEINPATPASASKGFLQDEFRAVARWSSESGILRGTSVVDAARLRSSPRRALVLLSNMGRLVLCSKTALRAMRWEAVLGGSKCITKCSLVGVRKLMLVNAAHVFRAEWLLDSWDAPGGEAALQTRRDSLHKLHAHFGRLLWGLSRPTCPYDSAPEEMFQHVSSEELWLQYARMHNLAVRVAALRQSEVFEVVACDAWCGGIRRRLPASRLKMNTVEVTHSGAELHRESVVDKELGRVDIIEWIRKPRDHLLHYALMKLKYEHVAAFGIWHILRLYHRCPTPYRP